MAILLVLCGYLAIGQTTIKGTIYDRSQRYPLQGVSVMGASGIGTVTDSLGHYTIRLLSADSIYFSYLGKYTEKFPVQDIPPEQPFDMSMEVAVESLPSVLVRPNDYHIDSLQNRIEYQKIFNYNAPGYLENMKMRRNGGAGVSIDLHALFDGKGNRRMEDLQQRLQNEEQDKYIDHRFTKYIVKKITGLEPPALDSFMQAYRPSYEFIQSCTTDYEFYNYISGWGKTFSDEWKKNHPE